MPADSFPDAPLDSPQRRADRERELAGTVQLLRRVREHDDGAALNELFARYYPRVLRYVQARTGPLVRSKREVEDLVQDTFLAAVEDIKSVKVSEPGELIHWLATVAEYQIRGTHDYLTARKRDPRLEVSLVTIKSALSSGSFRFEPVDRGESPDDALSRRELAEIVDQCLQTLSEDHRNVILLRTVAGASWDYVARTLGRPTPEAACMLHSRAKVGLYKVLSRRVEL